MDPIDNIRQTRDLAQRAIAFLDGHELAADPRSYTLAYLYYAGTHPEVRT